MTIGKKLTLGFTTIALLMVCVGALFIYQIISMQAITQRDIYKSFFILNSSWELMETIEHQQMAADRYLFLRESLDENRANYHYEKHRFIRVYDKFHTEAGEHIKQWLEEFYQKVLTYNLIIEEVFAQHEQGRELTTLVRRIKEAETIEEEAHKILWKIIKHVQNEHVEPAKVDIADKINSTIRITLVSVIASLLLAIGLGIYLTRSIAGPITKLKDTISAIGHGNFDAQVNITSTDEIGILADAFNQMLSDLKKSHTDLENVMAGLEERVKERTAELTKSQLAMSKMIKDLDRQAQELRDAQDKLVRSEKLAAIGQLASSVAHELRNPLGVMKNIVYYFNMLQWDKENLDIKDIMENLSI
ncbi:MAG: HAMP domain-containing protein, partial [bacterium]